MRKRSSSIIVEYVGGPICGKTVDKTHLLTINEFLPSTMVEAHNPESGVVSLTYVADISRPTTSRGTHRYVYRP